MRFEHVRASQKGAFGSSSGDVTSLLPECLFSLEVELKIKPSGGSWAFNPSISHSRSFSGIDVPTRGNRQSRPWLFSFFKSSLPFSWSVSPCPESCLCHSPAPRSRMMQSSRRALPRGRRQTSAIALLSYEATRKMAGLRTNSESMSVKHFVETFLKKTAGPSLHQFATLIESDILNHASIRSRGYEK